MNNHALLDSNERLGWLVTAVFLELNDAPASTVADDDVYDLVMAVASRHLEIDTITTRLRELIAPPCE